MSDKEKPKNESTQTQSEPKNKKFEFQAEIRQLLEILTHSLYTHRDIFIRELISNAADALDKVRFKSMKDEEIQDKELNYSINIETDDKNKILTISDTGIGMTKQELIDNIGTIARSGTSDFIKTLAKDKKDNVNLIGKFGVGFYSVFMAGERVELTTKSAIPGESPYLWTSDGNGSFEIVPGPKNAKRGTSVKVFLRKDAEEFAEENNVKSTIQKYSNFVPYPIHLNKEQVNKISAIWREPKSSVKEEQYKEFFKFIANETDDPLTHMHLSADVPIQFHSLLYVPGSNRELMGFGKDDFGISLFVRRVLVEGHATNVLPGYLRFVRGVIDSDDLPLNISREALQNNPYLSKIEKVIVGKFLGHLKTLLDKDFETYKKIWELHGRILKEGYTDYTHKDKLADVLLFNSSKSKDKDELISLSTYVDRMHEKQEGIYFLSGPSREALETNPNLELFRVRDIEVLYCYDPIDEFVLPGLMEYKGKNLISADQADVSKLKELPVKGDEKKEDKPQVDKQDADKLARRIKDILGDRVEDVRLSERLVDSPAILVGAQPGISSQMEKIMQMMDKDAKPPKRVMEINKEHPLIADMLQLYQKDTKSPVLEKITNRLYDSLLLLDGFLTDPHEMALGQQTLLTEYTKMILQEKDKTSE
jgi:molecular chaperone HtpG